MSNERPPTIDPATAQRWAKQAPTESPWLHEEIARRMESRLQWITRTPDRWLNWSPLRGGLQAHGLLASRYPGSKAYVMHAEPPQSLVAKKALQPRWWNFSSKSVEFAPPERPVQMLWANMALHMEADPLAVIRQWHQWLEVDGFLMFSCFGPDTLREIRALYAANGWPAPSHEFTDMHDWGDMLVNSGFGEPIVDMERITLTFSSPESLLAELRGLGRNLHLQRFGALRGKSWLSELKRQMPLHLASTQEPGRLQLTFEVIYGHAFKPLPRLPVAGQSKITLEEMRQTLGAGKAKPR
jgi:malonyl-CoA O-methyltransferase